MLNSTKVLNYIKGEIGFPWQFIELSDQDILDHIINYSMKTFAHYFPDHTTIGLNVQLASNRVANKANEYYINDLDGREIFSVSHVYYSTSNLYLFGHPPIGPMSMGELSQWAFNTEVAGWVKSFSSFNYTHVFKHPNILSIRPTPTTEQWIAIEYEREHAPDFSTITNDLQMNFLELCLADIMMKIGRIRKKYGDTLTTPFGQINLSSEIFDEGKEKRAEVIEKLTAGSLTNIVISFG